MEQYLSRALAGAGLAAAMVFAGCASHRNEHHTNNAAEETRAVSNDADDDDDNRVTEASPVASMCLARCDREERCGNIGKGKKYETRDACATKIEAALSPDLNKYECPKGYDQDQLNDCLNDIRNESCSNPVDTLERVVSCRTGAICEN